MLAPFGYEPQVADELTLRNCPFDRLTSDHADLVCAMNHTFVGAVAAALGCSGLEMTLDRSRRPGAASGSAPGRPSAVVTRARNTSAT